MNKNRASRIGPETKGELILLLTSFIWGMSFVTQRIGMRSIGPFTFNAIRFTLGALCLLPLIAFSRGRRAERPSLRTAILPGAICGLFLFAGSTFQQLGIVTTSAGNAGFITGIYVILVPIFGLFLKRKASAGIWIGAVLALTGLYFLSVKAGFSIGKGDILVLIGAFFWAFHILVIGHFAPKTDGLALSAVQFLTCSFLSLCAALPLERLTWQGLSGAAFPIAYSGIMSIGAGFTLQIYGQKRAHPGRASIIMSLESLFAALGGIIFLEEGFGWRSILGCALILSGMVAAQIEPKAKG